jgi:hypothetical protein
MRSSVAVASLGAAAALPGWVPALSAVESEAPAADSAVAGESGVMTEPLVAHIRDLSTGEIGLFSGEQEIVVHDPALANRLFNSFR